MRNAVLVSAVRTPVGVAGGAFKDLDRLDLSDAVIKEAIARAKIDSSMVEENVWGDIPLFLTPARYVWLHAGMNIDTACLTVNRGGATGLSAIATASAMIATGGGDVYMAGGLEQDSRRFYYLQSDNPYEGGSIRINSQYSSPKALYGDPTMLEAAQNLAQTYGITRQECDEYAARSHALALQGYEEGLHRAHMIPIALPQGSGVTVDRDETLCPGITAQALAALPGGVCTAGNCAAPADGAAACVVMEEEKARSLGLKPLLRFVDFAVSGVDPRQMGLGPVPAMEKVMKRNGMTVKDFSFIECDESTACQTLAVQRALDIPTERLNIRGGSIALGHPQAATGINLAAKAAALFAQQGGERCAITLCVDGGQGVAAIFENCN